VDSHVSGASRGSFDARQKIEELRRKKASTAGDNDGFPAFSARLCNLLLPEKFKPLVKYFSTAGNNDGSGSKAQVPGYS
jgi:hypothetical protein